MKRYYRNRHGCLKFEKPDPLPEAAVDLLLVISLKYRRNNIASRYYMRPEEYGRLKFLKPEE